MAGTAMVTYYHHSGFTVEVGKNLLIFDYWRGEKLELPQRTWIKNDDLAKYEKILVFVSEMEKRFQKPD